MSTKLLSPNFRPEKKVYLESKVVHGVEIEICPLSGGIWFDRFEIKKFDEEHEPLDDLLNVLPKNPIPAEVKTERRSPKHPIAIMQQRPYGPKGVNAGLIVDICPLSAGIWLDYNELQKIRELYPKEHIMLKLSEELVESVFKGISKNKKT